MKRLKIIFNKKTLIAHHKKKEQTFVKQIELK